MNHGAHEQLPSSSATRRSGKRWRMPPPVKHAVTNWMPSGWLKLCHSIISGSTSRLKSGVR